MLGEYGYNWAASIYDIPEEERYTESGDLIIPDEWDGHKVLGIADGEYIEIDVLVQNGNHVKFNAGEIEKATGFAIDFGWVHHPNFNDAMNRLQQMVDAST